MVTISMKMPWQNLCLTVVFKKWKKIPSLREFNMILNFILHADEIGHLFIVYIKFHLKNKKNTVV